MLVLATDREPVRARWLPALATGVAGVVAVSDWSGLLARVVDPTTRVVIVDPALPGLVAPLLVELAGSLPHRPQLRSIDEPVATIPAVRARPAPLGVLLRRAAGRRRSDELQTRLRYTGLGERAGEIVSRAAGTRGLVLIVGPRGTGKEPIARLIHRLATPGRAFVVVPPGMAWRPEGEPGFVYFEAAHLLTEVGARAEDARRAGWRVVVASRAPVDVSADLVLTLSPLRERPEALAPLIHHFVDVCARRLGQPRRRFGRKLVVLMQAWTWPQNERELERFVQDVLTAVPTEVVQPEHLPPTLRARLDPEGPAPRADLEGYEEMVAARLAAVVQGWHAAGGTDLHALIVDATERALLRLTLARTQGNRKAAARLLGVARNTLQAHLSRLGVSVSSE